MSMSKQLLIVDDDQEIRELLNEYLTRAGFQVLTAAEGNEMRQQLAQHSPDLIILDIMMPGEDGFTLCQQIRRDSQVPIIMLTAASDEADRVIGLELGADDYIAKPFSPVNCRPASRHCCAAPNSASRKKRKSRAAACVLPSGPSTP